MRKPKFHANGQYTEFYTARMVYPPVLPGTNTVLLMQTFGGEIKDVEQWDASMKVRMRKPTFSHVKN